MILIVDDHLDTGALLARLLKGCGYDAIAVSSGPAALRLLQTARPNVVILDNHMPDMSGFDVMRAIQTDALLRDVPVIFYSADADPDNVDEALRLGAKDYLVKASTPWHEVCATVSRYIHA